MELSKDWYNTEFEASEQDSKHRPPSVEYSFYTAVKTGDMEAVLQNCNADSFSQLEGTGVLSRNPVTNLKYHFVVTAAMITRYCIDGGMEPEQAYRLSDFYILKWIPALRSSRFPAFIMLWRRILPEKWHSRRKALFSPNQ